MPELNRESAKASFTSVTLLLFKILHRTHFIRFNVSHPCLTSNVLFCSCFVSTLTYFSLTRKSKKTFYFIYFQNLECANFLFEFLFCNSWVLSVTFFPDCKFNLHFPFPLSVSFVHGLSLTLRKFYLHTKLDKQNFNHVCRKKICKQNTWV